MNLKDKTNWLYVVITTMLLLSCFSCKIYSFQGASTSAKTIKVADFYNNTSLASANLAQIFTNSLKDYYQKNSPLKINDQEGELYIEGTITGYDITARSVVASQSSTPDVAALSRLTINIKITYQDTINPENSFKNKSFSFYEDFSNTKDFTEIQEDLEKRIFEQILLNIFNATVANW